MKDFAKKIYLLIKPFIKWQIIGLILTILGSVALFAAPLVSRHLIDEVIPAGSLHNLTWGLVFFFIVCVHNHL
ncbi:MAG TPA: hypothetical protein VIO64_20325 [Pseudobacteroides sp.]|uniref:hypothetical protein n=1 Tax=Pseudobacteroides sp. TaxID=1968840 RepID=UPI002F927269